VRRKVGGGEDGGGEDGGGEDGGGEDGEGEDGEGESMGKGSPEENDKFFFVFFLSE
jgi:hypothetical protein